MPPFAHFGAAPAATAQSSTVFRDVVVTVVFTNGTGAPAAWRPSRHSTNSSTLPAQHRCDPRAASGFDGFDGSGSDETSIMPSGLPPLSLPPQSEGWSVHVVAIASSQRLREALSSDALARSRRQNSGAKGGDRRPIHSAGVPFPGK